MHNTKEGIAGSQRGMTLIETLIAVLIFAVVFIAALMLYQAANRAYLQTDAAAIQQQNIRFGMDRMLETLRDGGAGYNTLGSPRLADEQIEGAWESAVFVRGNFDNRRENNLESTTFPIVTTGNDEIVGFVLRKNGSGTIPIAIKADLTGTGGRRDAIYTSNTNIAGEETSGQVMVAATTVAGQTDPPYQLAKVTFNASGQPQYEVIADNIYKMKFEYYGANGATTSSTAVITTASGSGSADAQRGSRAAVRRIKVKLMGMADRPDFNYNDPWQYGSEFSDLQGTQASQYHKFALEETVLSSNLGIVGRRHNTVPPLDLAAPTYITVCTGHCRWFHVRWPASTAAGVTDYILHVTAPAGNGYPAYDSGPLSVPGATQTTIRDFDLTGNRTYTFQVAAASAGAPGPYGPSVSLAAQNDSASTPSAVGAITASQDSNALTLNWTPVSTNTGSLPANSYCATAGTGGSATQPATSWRTRAIDMKEYKVYRIRKYSPSVDGGDVQANNSDFEVTEMSIPPLVNLKPGPNAGSFVDNTAAPCEQYYYKVKACDLCDVFDTPNAMPNPVSGADPQENPAAPTGLAGATSISGNNYRVTLNWPAVTQTVSTKPAAVAHYKIYRYRAVAPSTTYVPDPSQNNPFDVYEASLGHGPAALTYQDNTAPLKVGPDDASYEYAVTAVYTGCARESAASPRYRAQSCTAANQVTVVTPQSGIEISIPFESGFTPRITVAADTNNPTATISTAVATITGPNGSSNVIWTDTQTLAPPLTAPQTITFAPFDTAPQQALGTYLFNVVVTVNGCNTSPAPVSFILGDATCGLNATNVTLDPSSGNPKYYQLSFNVQNTCDASQGGLNFEVTGLSLSWSGYGGNRTIKEARLGSGTGTLLTSTPLNLSSGQPLAFLSNMHQTVNAGTTTANKWYVIFSSDMKQNASNNTSFGPISAQTTTPANANDVIIQCCQQY